MARLSGEQVTCDYERRPHPLNDDDRPCRNPKPVIGQVHTWFCINVHAARGYPPFAPCGCPIERRF